MRKLYKIIVQKFGGSSLKKIGFINNISKKIEKWLDISKKIIVIVSAPYGITDLLSNINKKTKGFKNNDSLISIGENISSVLLNNFLNNRKIRSEILSVYKIPIVTEGKYSDIVYISKKNIKEYLKNNDVLIINGFQSINKEGNIKTLKRGGSDTTAICISSLMKVPCFLFKDVNGIYQVDPKIIKTNKVTKVNIRHVREMSKLGAKVISLESIKKIKSQSIFILSSFTSNSPKKEIKNSTQLCYKENMNKNFIVKKKELLFDIKSKKVKMIVTTIRGISFDMLNLRKNNIYICINEEDKNKFINILKKKLIKYKIYKVYKISIIGNRSINDFFINFELIKKFILKKIINSLEIKISFLIRRKNIKIINKLIKKLTKEI
ncbi:amino acid kinase family protein [Candidatus Vidania fulgoroideorum]